MGGKKGHAVGPAIAVASPLPPPDDLSPTPHQMNSSG